MLKKRTTKVVYDRNTDTLTVVPADAPKLATLTTSLVGVIEGSGVSEADHKKHLREKHR